MLQFADELGDIKPGLWSGMGMTSFRNAAIALGLTITWLSYAVPSIEITNVPTFGSFENLGGRVLNASAAVYRVAVFIYVPGAGWYSKPFCDPQLTVIQPDSSWTADVTTGGSDPYATKFIALLVSSNYNEPCVQGPLTLPASVTAQAIASAQAERYDPNIRALQFSGYDWWVKSSPGPVGPGPNYFSESTNNVWVDAQGQLHLRITNRSNQWQCAEIVSRMTFGYGSYRFELGSSVNDLNLNAVLGLFTWSDDPAYAHREIDVECSRWGNPSDLNDAQFVVQPYDLSGHLARYLAPAGLTNSTHLFTWETNRISFQGQRGSYSASPGQGNLLTNWLYALTIPQSADENVRINLWLYNGNPPVGNSEVEFVVKSFQFVPLGPPVPPILTSPSFINGQFRFTIKGEMDRRYQIESTSNLVDWAISGIVLSLGQFLDYVDTNGAASTPQFFRTLTLP